MSQYNHPVSGSKITHVSDVPDDFQQFDIGLCAYTSQLRIMSRFHDEVYSDPTSPSGLNEVNCT